ncbi:MAG: ABC transporter permease subunit [Albidovulum sp.]
MAVIIGGWQRDCGACRGRRDWHALGQFNRLGHFLMRGVDVLMAFPALLMALVLITLLERSVVNTIIVIAIVYATTTARSLYGMTLKLKAAVFVDAAICSGAGHPSILFRQILPNLVSPLLVQASFIFAFAQLQAAALDFLGLGLPPEVPSCGKSLTSLAIMGLWVEAGGFPTKAIFWATPKFASPETRSIASGLRAPMAPLPSYR